MNFFEQLDCIDVVTTATLRPEVFDLCLQTFYKNFLISFRKKRLILNIDPIGEPNTSTNEMLVVAKKYFDEIIHRAPEKPGFASAVHWGWSQVNTEFFLHLEDDWLLRHTLDTQEIKRVFSDPEIAELTFEISPKDLIRERKLCLRPSIFRTRFIKEIIGNFNLGADPEKQWSAIDFSPWQFCVYQQGRSVIDTGKKWRNAYALLKKKSGVESVWANSRESKFFSGLRKLKYRVYLSYWKWRYGNSSRVAKPRT